MAGLGSISLEDVEDNTSDDLVKPPGVVDGEPPEDITVIITGGENKPPAVMTTDTLDRLAKANLQFTATDEGDRQAQSYAMLGEHVAAMESINRLDAEQIGATFGDKFTAALPLNMFSNERSLTNLTQVKGYVSAACEDATKSSVEMAKAFFAETANDVLISLQICSEKFLPSVMVSLGQILYENRVLVESCLDNPNLIIHMDGEFVNLAETDLCVLNPEKLPASTPNRLKVVEALQAIKAAISIPIVGVFLQTLKEEKPMERIFDPVQQAESQLECFSSKDLLCVLDSLNKDGLNNLIAEVQKVQEQMSHLQKKAIQAFETTDNSAQDKVWDANQYDIQIELRRATDVGTLSVHILNLMSGLGQWFLYLRAL